MEKETNNNEELLPLRDLTPESKYAMGYLSLMARRGQLPAEKKGKTWHTTLKNIKDFEDKMDKRKETRKSELSKNYFKKAEDTNSTVNVRSRIKIVDGDKGKPSIKSDKGDPEVNEVQNELEDVLGNIKNKEEKLKNGNAVNLTVETNKPEVSSKEPVDIKDEDSVTENVLSKLEGSLNQDEKEEAFSIPVKDNTAAKQETVPEGPTGTLSPKISDIRSKKFEANEKFPVSDKKPRKKGIVLKVIGILLISLSLLLAASLILSVN